MNRIAMIGVGIVGSAAAAVLAPGAVGESEKPKAESLAVYPLATCHVSGEKLGSMGEPVVKTYDDREVRFCCKGCVKDFEADQARFWKKIDAEIVKQQLPYYPTDTCVVSGEKLGGEMGEPVNYIWRNRLVRLCCKGCIGDLQKEPQKYLSKLDEAVIAQQRAKYPLTTCVVSGRELGSMGEPVEVIAANRLVRFCCKECPARFNAEPTAYLSKLEEAWKAGGG